MLGTTRPSRLESVPRMAEWMTCKRYFDLTPGDNAVRLDLISKVHGLEQAEKFFNNIPKRTKTIKTYSALLNCYVQKKSVEKVETLLKTMRALGFLNSFTYNVLLNFYYQMGQYEKLDLVMEEMKEMGIPFDIFTFRARMSAYVAASDINGMESILKRMEDDPKIVLAWDAYSAAANGYIKAGLADKAVVMLKKSEALTTQHNWVARNFLLTMYARIGRKDDVYRIWNLLNSSSKNITNASYLSMIISLTKLDDIEGAEKIMEEWESTCFCYDFRVPNQLIAAYCKKGLFHKAESFISKAIERGRTPYPSTWECMATGYVVDNQISKGVEMMKAALSANRTGWKPNTAILAACLEFFEKQGDVEGLGDFVRLLRLRIPLTRDVYHRLLRTHLVAGKPVSDVLNRMKEDGVDADEETEEILRGSPD
eukprot:TRINITY_DN5685_c0_g1_i1.p1 TRINITY_DN5685_c0_g1~~TRINITY_DN5685_c0_g1_i1.p1  ORF type:complete len:425 (+),score=76.54 TRINITY_DN5685_c0_g1_i1:373-1647(+)